MEKEEEEEEEEEEEKEEKVSLADWLFHRRLYEAVGIHKYKRTVVGDGKFSFHTTHNLLSPPLPSPPSTVQR